MSQLGDLAAMIAASPDHTWIDRSACGELDLNELNMFFVEAGRTLSKEAKAMCQRCEVHQECLDYALDHDIAGGYFGGMSPSKRRQLAQERATGEAVTNDSIRQPLSPATATSA